MTDHDELNDHRGEAPLDLEDLDEAAPRRVRVPTSRDLYGNPLGFIECEEAAVGHWDDSRWSAHPPV